MNRWKKFFHLFINGHTYVVNMILGCCDRISTCIQGTSYCSCHNQFCFMKVLFLNRVCFHNFIGLIKQHSDHGQMFLHNCIFLEGIIIFIAVDFFLAVLKSILDWCCGFNYNNHKKKKSVTSQHFGTGGTVRQGLCNVWLWYSVDTNTHKFSLQPYKVGSD